MNLYDTLLNAWVAECIYNIGHPLPMNCITEFGCGHQVADDEEALITLDGGRTRKFIINYRRATNDYTTTN